MQSLQAMDRTEFVFQNGTFFFVSGDAPLQAPEAYINRSPVLVDICTVGGGNSFATLSIDDACIRAWHRCVHVCLHAPQKLATRYGDEELIRALQAADYLQDRETAHAISQVFSKVFVPDKVRRSSLAKRKRLAPNKAQQERACQIVKALPGPCLHSILECIQRSLDMQECNNSSSEDRLMAVMCHLFILLPPSCHPAILYATQRSIATEGLLSIPRLPIDLSLDDTCHSQASLPVAMIAAASMFAQGSAAAIWDSTADYVPATLSQFPPRGVSLDRLQLPHRPKLLVQASGQEGLDEQLNGATCSRKHFSEYSCAGALDLQCSATLPAEGPAMPSALPSRHGISETLDATAMPASKRLRRSEPQLVHEDGLFIPVAASTQVTKLILDLTLCCPLIWSAAVQQLRTLRHLEVVVSCMNRACAPAIMDGFRNMPALQCLGITGVARPQKRPCGFMTAPIQRLFAAVAGASQIKALTLDRCFTTSTADSEPTDGLEAQHLHISSCSALTKLSIRGCTIRPHWAQLFAGSLLQLQHLIELDVSETCAGAAAATKARLDGGLSELVHIDMARTDSEWLGVASDHGQFVRLFQGVTWLSLKGACVGQTLVTYLATTLQPQRQLVSLDLSGNSLTDSGMVCVASVLRGLASLTRLDLGNNDCSHVGVFAALEALVDMRELGGKLRSLGLAGAGIHADAMQQYWEQLVVLQELEELDVSGALQAVTGRWNEERHIQGELGMLTRLVVADPSDRADFPGLPALSGLDRLREVVITPCDGDEWEMMRVVFEDCLPGVSAVSWHS